MDQVNPPDVNETTPAQPDTTAAVNVFKNIKSLLLGGLFQGQHAQFVSQAVSFLDQVIADAAKVSETPMNVEAITKAKAKRERKAKKLAGEANA